MSALFLITGSGWVLVPLTYGFIARVLTGPTLSPLGQLSVKVITPRIKADHKFVPGPPKRFAQAIGTAFTVTASVLHSSGNVGAARIVIAMLIVAAGLEAFIGLCLGCKIFAVLMKVGLVPESVCAECNDISLRIQRAN